MAGLKVITQPASEPVTLEEVKSQLRIELDDTSYDDILEPLITAAREWCEGYQNRAYLTQTLEIALDDWPCANLVELPRPPLQSVTSLIYADADGVDTTWAASNYSVDEYSFIPRLVKNRNVSWPSVCLAAANGVKIRYIAGAEEAADVPRRVKQAIILLVTAWFDDPGCEPPEAVRLLLNSDRVIPV
jgi:uncharacterized phiE125 gp8 family phage protein